MRLADGVRDGVPEPLDIFANPASGVASRKQSAAEQQQGEKFEHPVHIIPDLN
jgi:hypothetical protein